MKRSKTNTGFLYFLEKILRSHPLIYFIFRQFIIYTNIFEEDANGVVFLNLGKKVNIIDVGASDGIASKFFNRKLKINKIICFEPNKSYVRILKKLNIKNLIVNAYGISTETITNHSELEEKIRDVLNHQGPIVCDVNMHEHYQYEPRIFGWNTPIEDMYPYLPRDEFINNMYIDPVDGWDDPILPNIIKDGKSIE